MNSENLQPINPLESLSRGKACYTCRRRKTKCDGVRPACTQCIQRGRGEDCEYTDKQGRTRIQVLEEQVRLLQDRLNELESSEASMQPVLLHNPYESTRDATGLQRRSTKNEPYSKSRIAGNSIFQTKPDEVSHETFNSLIRVIIEIISDQDLNFGPSWFSETITSPLKDLVCSDTFPIPALLNATYLWVAKLSHFSELENVENTYYRLTEEALQSSLIDRDESNVDTKFQRKIHIIQAHILFAQYLFLQGRIFEGRYHSNAAVTLAISCRLHRIQPFSQLQSSIQAGGAISGSADFEIIEPRDIKDHGERIRTFWMVFILDRFWSAASGIPGAFADRHMSTTRIVTPWPFATETYVQAVISPTSLIEGRPDAAGTVQSFLSGIVREQETENLSSLALHAKAAALYEKSYGLVASLESAPPKEQEPILSELRALTYTAQDFLKSIHPLSTLLSQGSTQQPTMLLCEQDTLLLVHALAEGAMIRVYSVGRLSPGFEDARRALAHAQQVFRILDGISHRRAGAIDPMFSFLGLSASKVFLDDADSTLSIPGASSSEQMRRCLLHENARKIADALERCVESNERSGNTIFTQHAEKIFDQLRRACIIEH